MEVLDAARGAPLVRGLAADALRPAPGRRSTRSTSSRSPDGDTGTNLYLTVLSAGRGRRGELPDDVDAAVVVAGARPTAR